MNKKSFRYVALVAGSLALGGAMLVAQDNKPAAAEPQQQVDPSKVVIEMKGTKVTAGEFGAFVAALPPEARQLAVGPMKRQLAEELIRIKLLSNEARARGIDKQPRFTQQMDLMRDNVLTGMLLGDIQNQLVTDKDIEEYFAKNKDKLVRISARHILIPTQGEGALTDEKAKAKAAEIQKQLAGKSGEELVNAFAEVAKKESGDPGSKDDGGKLQPFTRGVMVPEFEKAAFAQEPGKVGEPVKSDFGYHVILVTEQLAPSLDKIKDGIADDLRQDKFETLYDDLRKQADPKFDASFFPAPAAPAAPAKQ